MTLRVAFILVSYIPYFSIQHFVWPLHWCLLADICNHTWIPECGTEDASDRFSRRLFIDECDMYEYNCDYEKDYVMINYSDCFNVPTTQCPPAPPCPSIPTCPDHRFHKMGDKYKFIPSRRMGTRTTTKINLPAHMLHGKRRYTPQARRKTRHASRLTSLKTTNNRKTAKTNDRRTAKKTKPTTMRTIILRKEEIVKNGKKMVKVVKAFFKKQKKPFKTTKDSDFLE